MVEERRRDHDQGGTLCRIAGVARYTPTEEGESYFDTPSGRSMLRPYKPLIINGCLGMNMPRYVCKIRGVVF